MAVDTEDVTCRRLPIRFYFPIDSIYEIYLEVKPYEELGAWFLILFCTNTNLISMLLNNSSVVVYVAN